MYPTHSGVRTLEDQDLESPGLLPSPLSPVQSPKPEVLAPDTSCSKVALMGAGEQRGMVSVNPRHRDMFGGGGGILIIS